MEDEKNTQKRKRELSPNSEEDNLTEVSSDQKVRKENWMNDVATDPRKRIIYEEVYPDEYEEPPPVEPSSQPAKTYPYTLDPFQLKSIECIERRESVLVSAHTSAGKTAVAEYAIAKGLRDNQRVIYTSPIKALSNQKYRDLKQEFVDVGLLTGDVTIDPQSSVLVMTTEILRSMLYNGNEILIDVGWVIYDEIHYMRDKERGVVWEESIILLPDNVRYVFLSATIPNARDFAGWIARIHKQKMNCVYTEYRPVPLQHYLLTSGGEGLHLVIDDKGHFRDQNFMKALGNVGMNALESQVNEEKRKNKKPTQDLVRVISLVMEKNLDPAIIFSFSKKDCETYALELAKVDFTNAGEKEKISEIYKNAIAALSSDDRMLPQVKSILPLLVRGVGIHHGGLLPILKETIEILFQEGLLKILFATETFAMGINMPAKTCIFTSLRKYDGKEYRMISAGEYIQMSGRAGRRNKDAKGIVIQMVDEAKNADAVKNILTGQADPLYSSFHLGYNMLLNLRLHFKQSPKELITQSFFQYQNSMNTPQLKEKLDGLKEEIGSITIPVTVDQLCTKRKAMTSIRSRVLGIQMTAKYLLPFIQSGRLIRVKSDGIDYGWGVIMGYSLNKDTRNVSGEHEAKYIVDVLLKCSERSSLSHLLPVEADRDIVMNVTQILINCIDAISTYRIFMPKDLRPIENRKSVERTVQEVLQRQPDEKLPLMDPVKDLKITDPDFTRLLTTYQDLEKKLEEFESQIELPREEIDQGIKDYERKQELTKKQQQITMDIYRNEQLAFEDTLRKMESVLRYLGFTDEDDVVQPKGRVACQINTADELLVTELIYNGVFLDLSPEQCVALLACLVFEEKTDDTPQIPQDLHVPLSKLRDTARRIGTVCNECKLTTDVEEYIESFNPAIMHVAYAWAKKSSFAEICKMTSIFEGTIVRCIRRLDELLREVKSSLDSIGDRVLAAKFSEASMCIKRGIVFTASLYL